MRAVYMRVKHSFVSMSRLELMISIVGTIEPITSIPQVTRVWTLRSAEELPLITWGFSLFATLLWLFYGFKIKSMPIVLTSTLWAIIYTPIVVAIVLFS